MYPSMQARSLLFTVLTVLPHLAVSQAPSAPGQGPPAPFATPQSDTWASPPGSPFYNQAGAIIAAAGYDNATSSSIQTAIDFESSNWATGSVFTDPFYQLPPNASGAAPGALLKVQDTVNASLFTFPPELAISRFIYQTQDFNGTAIPTSGYILWPFAPRQFPNISCDAAPTVVWAHGTSGINAECAPSHYQDLWYEYTAPIQLALQGYAVVATDYAGLGINKTADGKNIPHQWGANPAAANDVISSLQAARQAFPTELSEQFVVMGHSQGGGAAWATAQKFANKSIDGYLGTVAASPANDFLVNAQRNVSAAGPTIVLLANTALSLFPGFQLEELLSPGGIQGLKLYKDLSGCWAVRTEVVDSNMASYLQPDWKKHYVFNTFNDLISNGGVDFAGPMLVVQGTLDKNVIFNDTTDTVHRTCENVPGAEIDYVVFNGTDHVPTMFASQQTWLGWIDDRFAGRPTSGGCTERTVQPLRPVKQYQAEVNYYFELPQYQYEKGI